MTARSRRSFLKITAGALSAAGATAAAGAPRADRTTRRIASPAPIGGSASALIGCGGMGTGDLRDMLRSGAQCVALCDVDDAQSAKVRDLVGRDFSQTPGRS